MAVFPVLYTRKGLALLLLAALSSLILLLRLSGIGVVADEGETPFYMKESNWQQTMIASRTALSSETLSDEDMAFTLDRLWLSVERDFPIEWDWMLQDHGTNIGEWLENPGSVDIEIKMISRVLDAIDDSADVLRQELERLMRAKLPSDDTAWLDLYVKACEHRRALRLQTVLEESPRIVFAKHYNMGGSHYAYTEGLSDALDERHFHPGTTLCILEMEGIYGTVKTLIDDPNGVIRNPDVSHDGKRILFSWKKSDREDDYHLYEMDVDTRNVRQLTHGLGYADYEGVYLPNGDILFNSTRCVQAVDCWSTEVSNLYTCDPDGKYMRRLTFDQVHTNFPTVVQDGQVIYTRWDYSDRGQLFPQGLFQMNPDGTAQTEFYGNNSWFPTTIIHARGIPGTQKVLAIFTGHHSLQAGKLGILDPAKGRQENEGAQLIAPIRETPAVRIDAYGQDGELFQYPYPLNEREFLVTYHPLGWRTGHIGAQHTIPRFKLYYMTVDGERELLAADPGNSCNQPVPLGERERPHVRPSIVDYRKDTGVFFLQDIYEGPGLEGIERGTIERLRVIALEYRPTAIGWNRNEGPAGGSFISTPISIGGGAWDVKRVIGDAKVYEDGSAFFKVPARTPVYFQALDRKGHAVQIMRSWSTLQPGESFSCIGCHERKSTAPPVTRGISRAMESGPQDLKPFYGHPRGFSFRREIQPILDKHCISCHSEPLHRHEEHGFSLLGDEIADPNAGRSLRQWSNSYLALTRARVCGDQGTFLATPSDLVNWVHAQSVPSMLPPYHSGAARSRLITMLEEGHQGVRLSQEEMDKIACWIDLAIPYCGDYTESNNWSDTAMQQYRYFMDKRIAMEEMEQANIRALIAGE